MDVDVSDYWLTGVSFNFSGDYRYSLKLSKMDLSDISDTLDINFIRKALSNNKGKIEKKYDSIKVLFYDENDEVIFRKKLKELLQITVELNGKYYVFFKMNGLSSVNHMLNIFRIKLTALNFV